MNRINLNELARTVTLKEGKKRNLNMADVKEVMSILLKEMAGLKDYQIQNIIQRYRK